MNGLLKCILILVCTALMVSDAAAALYQCEGKDGVIYLAKNAGMLANCKVAPSRVVENRSSTISTDVPVASNAPAPKGELLPPSPSSSQDVERTGTLTRLGDVSDNSDFVNVGEAIIRIVILWTLGLTPPALIRYVFMKRPLEKWVAGFLKSPPPLAEC